MNSDIKLLAMDFDGVIADSIMECAVAAYNGYVSHNGLNSFILSPKDIDPFQISQFITTRTFIRSGEDYLYLFHAINEHVEINNQEDFDNFKTKYFGLKDTYYNAFYSARSQLLSDHYIEWMSLNPLFWDMDRFLNNVIDKVHIISTKAKKYIISILSHYNVRIDQENIHSTENGQSKADILKEIIDKNKASSNNTVYVDDHLDTLLKIQIPEVRFILAKWGYNNKDQHDLAEESNIDLISLDQFYIMYG